MLFYSVKHIINQHFKNEYEVDCLLIMRPIVKRTIFIISDSKSLSQKIPGRESAASRGHGVSVRTTIRDN